ncbi:unnamed protein product [Schistosoma mattheei]|uniref:Uncharacterized protein n=1 Tax=Schistosoma mattheei TaxID=31246 RepID=A0A3P8G340_9TREM|nr:unnamed protein product [Schistosoma mattheei]
MGLVSWMYLNLRVDVYSGTGTQYRSLQTPSRYLLSYYYYYWLYSILYFLVQYRILSTKYFNNFADDK